MPLLGAQSAKAYLQPFEKSMGGGGVRMIPPSLGQFVTVNSLVVRGLIYSQIGIAGVYGQHICEIYYCCHGNRPLFFLE